MGSGGGNGCNSKMISSSTRRRSAYGEASYWDKRYSDYSSSSSSSDKDHHHHTFDWYQKYASLAPIVRLYARPLDQPMLIVGCGNSALGEGMVGDGYQSVVNVDISSVVVDAMQKKYADLPQLKYVHMDVRDMSAFETSSFLAVIDKGTLDSLLCGHNSRQNAAMMLAEVYRVLKDDGAYILVTYGSPVYRLPLLKELSWTIKLHLIEKFPSSSKNQVGNLTSPVPLEDDAAFPDEGVVGKNSDVHYIYVCLKDSS